MFGGPPSTEHISCWPILSSQVGPTQSARHNMVVEDGNWRFFQIGCNIIMFYIWVMQNQIGSSNSLAVIRTYNTQVNLTYNTDGRML